MRKNLFLLLCSISVAGLSLSGCSSSTGPATGGGGSGSGLRVPSIDFGPVGIGQTKDTLVPFINMGTDSITITSNGLSSPEGIDANFSRAIGIGANGYRNFHIQFKPDSNGEQTAYDSIHYQTNGSSAISIMTLKANGGGSTSSGGALFASPSTVNFGSLPVGAWHDTTILLVNTGNGPVTIISSTMSGQEGQDTNFSRPLTLASSGYQTIHIQFNPAQTGARSVTDQITYASNGSSQTLTITLEAQGITPVQPSPGAGSTFTYSYISIDTNGNQMGPFDSTYTVVSNSLSYQGKSNVLVVRDKQGGLSYYHVEANGDISAYVDLSAAASAGVAIPSQWFTIPIASRQTISTPLFDTSISITFSGIPVTVQITGASTAQYVASPTITAAGKSFATDEGSLVITINASGGFGLFNYTTTNTTNIFYSKQLGFYPKRTENSSSTQTGQTTPTTTSDAYVLKSYNVK